ncbi:feruloyl-CoA synthase [Aurantivibrio plasticivorans]
MNSTRDLVLGSMQCEQVVRADGCTIVSNTTPLDEYPITLLDRLVFWAGEKPDHTFIAERSGGDGTPWRKLSYRTALDQVRHIASRLAVEDLSAERPVAILSGNSIDHALVALAAMYIGVPYAPLSPQYSLISTDYSKLKHCLNLITPGMIFVDDGSLYEKAIAASADDSVNVLVTKNLLQNRASHLLSDFLDTDISPSIDELHGNIDGDTIAKFLFSSGSTGKPKAVINTHKMWAANQQMIKQALPFIDENKNGGVSPVLLDWLPWNHTFGGNHNFGITLFNGGTLYIDNGKPTPNGIASTVANLKEVSPTVYFNVPKGYEELVKYLETDDALCESFFKNVSMLFYAGAGLSQPVWDALEALSLKTTGEKVIIVTGLGSTETAPSALFTTGDNGFAGWLGLPVSGVDAKLVPAGGKTEIRFKGDSVTPGYWREPKLTENAFDEEGYYRTGDAVLYVDKNDLNRGFSFDGRISEDFKLDTGTWVSAGPLRAQFLNQFGNLVADVVIAGRDKPAVSALVFPDYSVCRQLAGGAQSEVDIANNDNVKAKFSALLKELAKGATGSSNKVIAISLQTRAPELDAHEITDKGSLNASAIQSNRADVIDSLYCNEEGLVGDCVVIKLE